MTEPIVSGISSRFAKLNPFTRPKHEDDEDVGEQIDTTTVAGGGHSARQSQLTRSQLRVSNTLRSFLVDQKVLSKQEASLNSDVQSPAVEALLDQPHIKVSASVTDRSHPLPEYFISSSHNTYLMAHQLYGTTSANGYKVALTAGSRCVEIDAWDGDENKDEPKVTHGWTLVSSIPFRSVCEAIRDVVDKEGAESVNKQGYRAAPILLSLENHCDAHGQLRLVEIMKEVLGDRLLSASVRQKGREEQQGSGRHVRLEELGSKIAVIVEYHLPEEAADDDDTSSGSEDEAENQAYLEYKAKEKETATTGIIPELADLGVYAQSVKPGSSAWYEREGIPNAPHHPLVNLSESGLVSHMPAASDKIARNNAQHLMRVYPKGTRISSRNLKPVPFWGVGAQICAMNWQTFGASMQLNEALFSGSDGYVLKPAALRAGGNGKLDTGKKKRLRLHIGGATDVPVPTDRKADDIKPYVTCTLVHPDDLEGEPPKRKTSAYKQHKIGFLHGGNNPPSTDPFWDETLEWEFEDNELVFLRILIKSDDSFARNPIFAVAAVRLMYVVDGWTFIRMLDLKGRETRCTVLVKFELSDL
jgi:phosphatidylinositol phospholipase C delta